MLSHLGGREEEGARDDPAMYLVADGRELVKEKSGNSHQ